MNKKGVVLLSGGLDSLVSLDIAKKECNIKLALTFNYGQKAFEDELEASEKICQHYNIEHKVIELPFLKKLTKNALTQEANRNLDDLKNVWVPNRNGLFLNIAGSYCDKLGYDLIIFGANRQEGVDFPDNTFEFLEASNQFFKYATLHNIEVFAPCINFDKIQIINYAIDNNVPLKYLKSCYDKTIENKKHCGKCMSCKLLFEAIKNSKNPNLAEELFNAD